jgi:hypothetical protein
MRNVLMLILLILLVTILWLYSDRFHRRQSHFSGSPASTINSINGLYLCIRILELDSHRPITDLLQGHNLNLNEQITADLRSKSYFAGIPISSNGLEVLDDWQNPFVIMWKADFAEGKLASGLAREDGTILIWSVGPNGSNEFGFGDDVFISPRATRK